VEQADWPTQNGNGDAFDHATSPIISNRVSLIAGHCWLVTRPVGIVSRGSWSSSRWEQPGIRETTMSERWNIPRSKGVGEKLTAIIGLIGVLVGSLISIGSNYFLAVRAERAEQENAQRTRNADMKIAARLVSDQLAAVAAGAQMLFEEKKLPEK